MEDVCAKLESPSAGGWRPLHHAVAGGHVRAVEVLLAANADVDARVGDQAEAMTSLHLASMGGHHLIVELLMQCGANPNLLTQTLRRSALHLAGSLA